jgi:hypothetical protein
VVSIEVEDDMVDERPLRVCEACGQVDDHPRHVHASVLGGGDLTTVDNDLIRKVLKMDLGEDDEARILADLYDKTSVTLHFDCCAARGCPTGACGAALAENGGKTREDLVRFVEKRARALNRGE